MTTQAVIVWGLVALLTLYAALLWRAAHRRRATAKAARRALRLEQQLAWDRMLEDKPKAP